MLLLFVEVVSGPDLGSLYNLLNKIKRWQWVWKTLTWHPLKICFLLSLSSIYFFYNYILQVCLKILKLQLTVYFCKYGIFWHSVLIFPDNCSLNRLWNGCFNLSLLNFSVDFLPVASTQSHPRRALFNFAASISASSAGSRSFRLPFHR